MWCEGARDDEQCGVKVRVMPSRAVCELTGQSNDEVAFFGANSVAFFGANAKGFFCGLFLQSRFNNANEGEMDEWMDGWMNNGWMNGWMRITILGGVFGS